MTHSFRSRLAPDFWDLLTHFFEAQRQFRETYDTYETKVLQYAEERGVDRRFLRLSAEEVAGLLDFRKLERLRNDELQALKAISHAIFRGEDSTDPFDRTVSQIFHELSILKEEQYKVSTFAAEYRKLEEAKYEAILDEVHEAFPRQVHGIYEMFQRAQGRVEELLPQFARGPQAKVLVRSMYLFGDEVFRGFYPNGVEDVYELVYPAGAVGGYFEAARSFNDGGFREYAIEALEKALRAPEPRGPGERLPGEGGRSERGEGVEAAVAAQAARREAEELLRGLKEAPKKKPPGGGAAPEKLPPSVVASGRARDGLEA